MRDKRVLVSIILSIIPLGVVILNIVDIYDVYWGAGDYPFGSEFFSSYSIYRTKAIYISYDIIFSIVLILAIFFAFKQKWKFYLLFLFIGGVFFAYPLFFNT